MDLRSIINVNEAADSSAQKHAPTPVTPSQAGPPLFSRDFSNHPQASPYRHPSQDLGPPAYKSPTTFQGAYHTRPAPPLQLQPPSQSDLRSPAASSHSAQSPYRSTPTSSFSGHQYPFPQNQPPPSPVNHQISLQQQHRDSYSHSANPSPQIQHHNSYSQSPSVPQTPPVGTPGSSYPYPPQHQRSHSSSHSTSTPTSAQSQHQFYGQQIHDSPVSVGHPQYPQAAPHPHHQSQPGTPLGPPISIPRQSSIAYPQPQSPYSQRAPSTGGFAPQYSNSQASPASQIPQISRLPSTPTSFEQHRLSANDPNRRSQSERSQSERDRSLSVSPKTRLPSHPKNRISPDQSGDIDGSGGIKREREDSDSSQPVTTNGRQSMDSHTIAAATPSPVQPERKRTRYTQPPIWARSWKESRGKHASPLITTKQPLPLQANGNTVSRPPVNLIDTNPTRPSRPAAQRRGDGTFPSQEEMAQEAELVRQAQLKYPEAAFLGLWEPNIEGKLLVGISRKIADWLFVEVVNRGDHNELASRGIQIEIEAKLGTLIDTDTQQRLRLPVQSDCILHPGGRGVAGERTVAWAFSSSMTEDQHKAMNDFLNKKAQISHGHGEDESKKGFRVPIKYKHRRERDRFYELPRSMRSSLPPVMQSPNPNHSMKVRVTHDVRTNELLAKIIKARVADLDIYLPEHELDCRISINLEMAYEGDVEDLRGASSPDRNKDRLSYTHGHYQYDLTQVTMGDGSQRPTKEHELEIELSTATLIDQGSRAQAGLPNAYPELVQGLLDDIRILARNVPRP